MRLNKSINVKSLIKAEKYMSNLKNMPIDGIYKYKVLIMTLNQYLDVL
jgi:hypothetical protein